METVWKVNDLVEMKKPHPCGETVWQVLHIGAEVRLRCTRCKREVLLARTKAEKSIVSKIETP